MKESGKLLSLLSPAWWSCFTVLPGDIATYFSPDLIFKLIIDLDTDYFAFSFISYYLILNRNLCKIPCRSIWTVLSYSKIWVFVFRCNVLNCFLRPCRAASLSKDFIVLSSRKSHFAVLASLSILRAPLGVFSCPYQLLCWSCWVSGSFLSFCYSFFNNCKASHSSLISKSSNTKSCFAPSSCLRTRSKLLAPFSYKISAFSAWSGSMGYASSLFGYLLSWLEDFPMTAVRLAMTLISGWWKNVGDWIFLA